MPPTPSKANYRTYEAQARMVRAIVAAHPEVKWNYKEIALCYGSDMTEHALNHRFRKIRAQGLIIREGRARGFDMKRLETDEAALPVTQESVDKKNIAKYFGQSTADGIQFQFRSIKKDADVLRKTESKGGDVANCLSIGTGSSGGGALFGTPSKPTSSRQGGSRSGATSKRSRKFEIKQSFSDEDDDLEAIDDWGAQDETPSKRIKTEPTRGQRGTTPSRRAATKARDTIAETSAAALQDSESPHEVDTPTNSGPMAPASSVPESLFGNVERKPSIHAPDPDIFTSKAFKDFASDGYFSTGVTGYNDGDFETQFHSMAGDGEI